MLQYDFMINAFAASGMVAVTAGLVGWFLVLRAESFAGHALGHVGFAGATAAVLIGLPPLVGLIALTLVAGAGMGAFGKRLPGRDVAMGVVLSFSLGLGLLCLHFVQGYATQATALLFGNVLGVDRPQAWTLGVLAAVCLTGLGVVARPLLFASLQPELAEAKGVPVRLVSVLFLILVALAVSGAAQIVGVLLVFALMVGPPATALALTTRVATGLLGGVVGFGGSLGRNYARLVYGLARKLLDHGPQHGRVARFPGGAQVGHDPKAELPEFFLSMNGRPGLCPGPSCGESMLFA